MNEKLTLEEKAIIYNILTKNAQNNSLGFLIEHILAKLKNEISIEQQKGEGK